MLASEINSFAFRTGLDKQFGGRRAHVIVVLPKDGKDFYCGSEGVTPNRDHAFVYRYDDHGVADQCEQVLTQTGNKPKVIEVCPTAWRRDRKVVPL